MNSSSLDVAKPACVDVSTVSRALNNTSYVHPETKKEFMFPQKSFVTARMSWHRL
ncbi:MAG: helix-turn-helix domain-containing protein [Lachnoanaerobaculum sp.]|nr:helix-turn-helix domain-containing protein [Lachnoanaerobaculum sp.]